MEHLLSMLRIIALLIFFGGHWAHSTANDSSNNQNKTQIIDKSQRSELEWKWLFNKLILGST